MCTTVTGLGLLFLLLFAGGTLLEADKSTDYLGYEKSVLLGRYTFILNTLVKSFQATDWIYYSKVPTILYYSKVPTMSPFGGHENVQLETY